MTKRKTFKLPTHVEFRQAMVEAHELGADYFEWDEDQLVQSAEYANDVLPSLRSMAGYQDNRMGTWTVVPRVSGMEPDAVEDELSGSLDELLGSFWEGYMTRRLPLMDDDEDDE